MGNRISNRKKIVVILATILKIERRSWVKAGVFRVVWKEKVVVKIWKWKDIQIVVQAKEVVEERASATLSRRETMMIVVRVEKMQDIWSIGLVSSLVTI